MTGPFYAWSTTLTTGASVTSEYRRGVSCDEFYVEIPSMISSLGILSLQSRPYGASVWRDVYTFVEKAYVKYEIDTSKISNAMVPVIFRCQELRLRVQMPTTHSSHEFTVLFKDC